MSINLSDIAKFAKLVGSYDADALDASIRSHLMRLQLYADMDDWDDEMKLAVVTTTVKGRAFDYIIQQKYTTYVSLSKGLIEKFDSLDTVSSLSNQLFALRQGSCSITEHAKKFDIILNKLHAINAPILPPEILMNVFVDGIKYEYKKEILLGDIKTYEEALKRAGLMERLDAASRVVIATVSNSLESVMRTTVANAEGVSVNVLKRDKKKL
jgi:hypothetical protein